MLTPTQAELFLLLDVTKSKIKTMRDELNHLEMTLNEATPKLVEAVKPPEKPQITVKVRKIPSFANDPAMYTEWRVVKVEGDNVTIQGQTDTLITLHKSYVYISRVSGEVPRHIHGIVERWNLRRYYGWSHSMTGDVTHDEHALNPTGNEDDEQCVAFELYENDAAFIANAPEDIMNLLWLVLTPLI